VKTGPIAVKFVSRRNFH